MIVLIVLGLIEPLHAAERPAGAAKTEQAQVAAIRAKANLDGIDPALVGAVRRIDEVRGQIEFDRRGRLIDVRRIVHRWNRLRSMIRLHIGSRRLSRDDECGQESRC